MLKGFPVGIFAPENKMLRETFQEIRGILAPAGVRSNQQEGVIRLPSTGGRVDFWSLDNPDAGRSRAYWKVIIDEAAFAKSNAIDIWLRSIEPTLLDYQGTADVMSNTKGDDPENFFWKLCKDPKYGFKEFHAPSRNNPLMPKAEIERLRRERHPLVFAQEYEAEFVNWAEGTFFDEDKLLLYGKPAPMPSIGDSVFVVIDSAIKDGREHDGTAASYWLRSRHFGIPLMLLDWELVQIQGALLETWLPDVFKRGEELARICGAREGFLGAYIEDKGSGTVLLQQAQIHGWPADAIPSAVTAMGKDGRAINIGGHVHQGFVKFSELAYNKTTEFKGARRNHMLSQVLTFRIGDKKAGQRADDLLDTFTSGIAIALGGPEGY